MIFFEIHKKKVKTPFKILGVLANDAGDALGTVCKDYDIGIREIIKIEQIGVVGAISERAKETMRKLLEEA